MATYLVVDESGEIPVITEVEGVNIARALESLTLKAGDKLTVYRTAGPPRKVAVHKREYMEYSIG